jgi:acyl dehydratase
LAEFSDCIMLLYGMDGDPAWNNRHTRFLGEVYAGDELQVKYVVSDKKEDKGYGILAIDFEITRARDSKLVVVSRKNLYRIKKQV